MKGLGEMRTSFWLGPPPGFTSCTCAASRWALATAPPMSTSKASVPGMKPAAGGATTVTFEVPSGSFFSDAEGGRLSQGRTTTAHATPASTWAPPRKRRPAFSRSRCIIVIPRPAEAWVPRRRSVLRANWLCRSNAAIAAVMITSPTAAATISSSRVKPRLGSVRADIGGLADGDGVASLGRRGGDLDAEEVGRDCGPARPQLGRRKRPRRSRRAGGVHHRDRHVVLLAPSVGLLGDGVPGGAPGSHTPGGGLQPGVAEHRPLLHLLGGEARGLRVPEPQRGVGRPADRDQRDRHDGDEEDAAGHQRLEEGEPSRSTDTRSHRPEPWSFHR